MGRSAERATGKPRVDAPHPGRTPPATPRPRMPASTQTTSSIGTRSVRVSVGHLIPHPCLANQTADNGRNYTLFGAVRERDDRMGHRSRVDVTFRRGHQRADRKRLGAPRRGPVWRERHNMCRALAVRALLITIGVRMCKRHHAFPVSLNRSVQELAFRQRFLKTQFDSPMERIPHVWV